MLGKLVGWRRDNGPVHAQSNQRPALVSRRERRHFADAVAVRAYGGKNSWLESYSHTLGAYVKQHGARLHEA
jgi:hypothetical protein